MSGSIDPSEQSTDSPLMGKAAI